MMQLWSFGSKKMKPPGWKLPADSKRDVGRVRRIQGALSEPVLKQLARSDRAGRSHAFMCEAGYYRDPKGRFKKMDKFGHWLARRHKVAGS